MQIYSNPAPFDTRKCTSLPAMTHFERGSQNDTFPDSPTHLRDAALHVDSTTDSINDDGDIQQQLKLDELNQSGDDTNNVMHTRLIPTTQQPNDMSSIAPVRANNTGIRSRVIQRGRSGRSPLTVRARKHLRVNDRNQTPTSNQRPCRADQQGIRSRIPQNMQLQWRVGPAPSAALTLSKDENRTISIISQASAFHTSMFEVFWEPALRESSFVYDLDNRVEIFRDSSVTAVYLAAAGKPESVQRVLNRMIPGMDDLLRRPIPALYLTLAELALDLARTPGYHVREQIKQYLAGRALSILGAEHPITQLLMLQLPRSEKEILGERLWKTVLMILEKSFGADHYQSSTQVYCQARNMAASGHFEAAIRYVEELIGRWGNIYGNNSLIVCYTKIELANMLARADSIVKAELVASDALRISKIVQQATLSNEDCHASEKRHRQSSLAFSRVAGLRTLGKLHCLRRNFGAATHYYSQAVAEGTASLGADSAVVELAQNDLNSSLTLELDQSLKQLSLDDLSKLTNIVPCPVC